MQFEDIPTTGDVRRTLARMGHTNELRQRFLSAYSQPQKKDPEDSELPGGDAARDNRLHGARGGTGRRQRRWFGGLVLTVDTRNGMVIYVTEDDDP